MATMDRETVRQALAFDPDWVRSARQTWLALMELVVWGDLASSRLGTMNRVGKKALEVGEKLKSLVADRAWIPHPREQIKSALAAALGLNDSVSELERTAVSLDGGNDLAAFSNKLGELRRLLASLAPFEHRWAQLLDSQLREGGQ